MLEVIAQHDYAGSRFLRGVAIDEAFRDPKYAQGPFARLYDLLATDAIDLNHGERLVRVGRQLSEYLVFQTMWRCSSRASATGSAGRWPRSRPNRSWRHESTSPRPCCVPNATNART